MSLFGNMAFVANYYTRKDDMDSCSRKTCAPGKVLQFKRFIYFTTTQIQFITIYQWYADQGVSVILLHKETELPRETPTVWPGDHIPSPLLTPGLEPRPHLWEAIASTSLPARQHNVWIRTNTRPVMLWSSQTRQPLIHPVPRHAIC